MRKAILGIMLRCLLLTGCVGISWSAYSQSKSDYLHVLALKMDKSYEGKDKAWLYEKVAPMREQLVMTNCEYDKCWFAFSQDDRVRSQFLGLLDERKVGYTIENEVNDVPQFLIPAAIKGQASPENQSFVKSIQNDPDVIANKQSGWINVIAIITQKYHDYLAIQNAKSSESSD